MKIVKKSQRTGQTRFSISDTNIKYNKILIMTLSITQGCYNHTAKNYRSFKRVRAYDDIYNHCTKIVPTIAIKKQYRYSFLLHLTVLCYEIIHHTVLVNFYRTLFPQNITRHYSAGYTPNCLSWK